MFTGIVEVTGRVLEITRGVDSARISIEAPEILVDAVAGASISVNGICLTVVAFNPESFSADVMLETLNRSTLGELVVGSEVNLERAMPANGRLGGHIVQGHVDAPGVIEAIREEPDWTTMDISIPANISPYVVEKGSITVNGISLTVVSVTDPTAPHQMFSISLIPTTLTATNLGSAKVGDKVNIEVDALAKYVERLLAFKNQVFEQIEEGEVMSE
jgi:riboflavin synthase